MGHNMTQTDAVSAELRPIREFEDEFGKTWIAGVRGSAGKDFKGRYYFVARRKRGDAEDDLSLEDVRWNSESAARRTVESMSSVELRRRLRSALGRAARHP